MTLVGLSDAVRPEGVTEEDKEILPENPLRLARLMVTVPEEPDWRVRLVEPLEMLKSGVTTTLTVTVVV